VLLPGVQVATVALPEVDIVEEVPEEVDIAEVAVDADANDALQFKNNKKRLSEK
jgi:hypothetical protein